MWHALLSRAPNFSWQQFTAHMHFNVSTLIVNW
jgi:hypothetical protein